MAFTNTGNRTPWSREWIKLKYPWSRFHPPIRSTSTKPRKKNPATFLPVDPGLAEITLVVDDSWVIDEYQTVYDIAVDNQISRPESTPNAMGLMPPRRPPRRQATKPDASWFFAPTLPPRPPHEQVTASGKSRTVFLRFELDHPYAVNRIRWSFPTLRALGIDAGFHAFWRYSGGVRRKERRFSIDPRYASAKPEFEWELFYRDVNGIFKPFRGLPMAFGSNTPATKSSRYRLANGRYIMVPHKVPMVAKGKQTWSDYWYWETDWIPQEWWVGPTERHIKDPRAPGPIVRKLVHPSVQMTAIELRLTAVPFNVEGRGLIESLDYLGLKNFQLIYVPGPEDEELDEPAPIPKKVFVVRHSSTKAHDDRNDTYWESGPQGSANSVVPFYLDIRQPDGSATSFDLIRMVPLWASQQTKMSVYYSNDDSSITWALSPNKARIDAVGTTPPSLSKGSGLLTLNGGGWEISNDVVRLDVSRSFMIGLTYQLTDLTTLGRRTLWQVGNGTTNLRLVFNVTSVGSSGLSGVFQIEFGPGPVGTVLAGSTPVVLSAGAKYMVIVAWQAKPSTLAKGWYFAHGSTGSAFTIDSVPETVTWDSFFPTIIRLGSTTDGTASALGYISRLWVRMDEFDQIIAQSYFSDPDGFVAGKGAITRVNGHYNGVLAASLLSDAMARVGPDDGFFANKVWIPIPREFDLASTDFKLPLTSAKFIKLEFTGLIKRTYQSNVELLPVRHFPDWVRSHYRQLGGPAPPPFFQHSVDWYVDQVMAGAFTLEPGQSSMPDYMRDYVRSVLGDPSTGSAPATIYSADEGSVELLMSTGPDAATVLREMRFGATLMKFFRQARHEYETIWVPNRGYAYFVGIKEIKVIRDDMTVLFDTPQYVDNFDDKLYVESGVN